MKTRDPPQRNIRDSVGNGDNTGIRAERVIQNVLAEFDQQEQRSIDSILGEQQEVFRQRRFLGKVLAVNHFNKRYNADPKVLRAQAYKPDPPVLELPPRFSNPGTIAFQDSLRNWSEARAILTEPALRDADKLDKALYHRQTQLTVTANEREYRVWRSMRVMRPDYQAAPERPNN
ncbi:hypothetical protein K458DRAFT_397041 [Lentithecium fluviatile CBS 122367]|uniref:Uncharacterized protein n=1 Tax=Lentithecium fluviatile CBS 122367 TaxID=1168545 RepID=A0A6G1IE53_9PLEO|nr:hypothetical protein K458DRAFT_397041 [Lentithecium fluviatile CBS 122367]